MEYRTLGTTGVRVSTHCLGAMMFGSWGNTDVDACVRMVHEALDAGINFVDTADVYSAGESERIVAKALAERRDEVVLATKIHRPEPETAIEETLGALTDLQRAGKIRYFGSSTFPGSQLEEAAWVAERNGLSRFRTEQPPYSIFVRQIEMDVLPVAQRLGMGVLVWS